MYSRLYDFIEINNILSKNQFGFKGENQLNMECLIFMQTYSKQLKAKKKPASFKFLDVLKVFDTVNRNTSGQTRTLWYKGTPTYLF